MKHLKQQVKELGRGEPGLTRGPTARARFGPTSEHTLMQKKSFPSRQRRFLLTHKPKTFFVISQGSHFLGFQGGHQIQVLLKVIFVLWLGDYPGSQTSWVSVLVCQLYDLGQHICEIGIIMVSISELRYGECIAHSKHSINRSYYYISRCIQSLYSRLLITFLLLTISAISLSTF